MTPTSDREQFPSKELVSRLLQHWRDWESPTDRDSAVNETRMAFDCKAAADEIERLTAERDEWKRGSEVVNARLLAEVERLTDVLQRSGFRKCDIPACNCGSWHHVGGFAERFREIDEATADDERNGETLLTRIGRIVADRERLTAAIRMEAAFCKENGGCCFDSLLELCGPAGVAPEPGVAYPRGWCAQHGYWVELEGDRAGCPKCRAAETPAERKT